MTIEYVTRSAIKRQLGIARLSIDIVDYPGEWLTDLGLMPQSYADWCATALNAARDPRRRTAAGAFLEFLASVAATNADDEPVAIQGAALFTQYLGEVRQSGAAGAGDPTLGPGRFLLPGELAGSPLLTFFPLIWPRPPTVMQMSPRANTGRCIRCWSGAFVLINPMSSRHFFATTLLVSIARSCWSMR